MKCSDCKSKTKKLHKLKNKILCIECDNFRYKLEQYIILSKKDREEIIKSKNRM